MQHDMFQTDAKVLLFRTVVNDAVVGPWQELQGVTEHNEAGLKKWMLDDNLVEGGSWDPSKLEPGGFDHHLRNYGLRLQFWVPDVVDSVQVPGEEPGKVITVVCRDAVGLDDLTEGEKYEGVVGEDGLYEIEDDHGEKRGFFRERFERLKAVLMRV